MTKLLFLGRFQPVHNGHIQMIKELSNKYDNIVIAVGSADKANTFLNPFTAKQRKEMIRLALKNTGIKYETVSVSDVKEDEHFPVHVQTFSLFDEIFVGSEYDQNLFKNAGCKVFPFNETSERYGNISASKIRNLIKQNKEWEHLVPKEVAEYIKQIQGDKLIQSL